MIHLRAIKKKEGANREEAFPLNLPVVRTLDRIEFRREVTFLVGENGSGKSTILEAVASAVGVPGIGGADVESDETLGHARLLAKHLRLEWNRRTRRGFFLRAEDFFNFARRIKSTGEELERLAADYEDKFTGSGLMRARGAILGQKAELRERYGDDLDANSHGESFLKLFQSRFVPRGIYLLDEPEAPLSPLRQLALISMLRELVESDSQLIIATHSPILMAFPGATILNFDSLPVRETPYEELDHVNLTRAFLNNPEAYLRRL